MALIAAASGGAEDKYGRIIHVETTAGWKAYASTVRFYIGGTRKPPDKEEIDMDLMDLKIDPEFADKIPPLTREEFEQLEANILADGVIINPLIVWNGLIVDGHNRFRILQKHPEIPYTIHIKEFSDRYDVIAWICKNQLGRRNLTPAQRKYLIGKQYEAEKSRETFHGNQHTTEDFEGDVGGGQNVHHQNGEKTSERIAREIGSNERYVRRAEEFAKGLDAAEEVSPGIKQEVFSGTLKTTDSDVAAIARAAPDERQGLVENLRKPKPAARGQPVTNAPAPDEDDEVEDLEEDSEEETEPYTPSKASIRQISAAMASDAEHPEHKMPTAFILEELTDALDSMIFRWDFMLSEHRDEADDKECRRQIQVLVDKGKAYLKLYRGGKKRDAV